MYEPAATYLLHPYAAFPSLPIADHATVRMERIMPTTAHGSSAVCDRQTGEMLDGCPGINQGSRRGGCAAMEARAI